MKKISALITLFFALSAMSQVSQYQAINGKLLIITNRDGQEFKYNNDKIVVNLDYRTGAFIVNLKNTDFYQTDSIANLLNPESTVERKQFSLTGFLPIEQIIDQKVLEQTYKVELQLINNDLALNERLNLSMVVTRTNSGSRNFRVFNIRGKLNNDELQLPAFKDFNKEIDFYIQFRGLATSN